MSTKRPQNDDQDLNKIAEDLSNELAEAAFTRTYQAFQKFFNQFQQNLEKFRAENNFLQKENAELKEKYNVANERFASAMSELAKFKRIEEGETSLQTAILADKFKHLKNQDFENIVKKIFGFLSILDINNVKQCDEKTDHEKTRLRAILARYILLEDAATDNTTIINNIKTSLGILEEAAGWEEIQERLQELVEKSRQLLTDIRSTDPPGRLVGDSFNSDQHEVPPGFEASGRVTSIIFPAYYVRDSILVPALVLTEPDRPFRTSGLIARNPSTEDTQTLPEAVNQEVPTEDSHLDQSIL